MGPNRGGHPILFLLVGNRGVGKGTTGVLYDCVKGSVTPYQGSVSPLRGDILP